MENEKLLSERDLIIKDPKEEWRPDDWMKIANRIRAHFDQARSVIVNRDVFESGASVMLSARDKWWVEQIELLLFKSHCLCYPISCGGGNCPHFPCQSYKWQSLKQSILEVKE